MTALAQETVTLLLRATVLLAVSALLVRGLIWRLGLSSPTVQRMGWFLVLVQGLVFFYLPVEIAWQEAKPPPIPAPQRQPLPRSPLAAPSPLEPATASPAGSTPVADVETTAASVGLRGEPARRFDWATPVMALWLAGLVCVLGLSLLGYGRFLRGVSTAGSVPEPWADQWQRLLEAHGIRRPIPLKGSGDVGPVLCWTPRGYRLIVPGPVWAKLSGAQRAAALRHELAHFRRGDLWKTLLVRLLALPHWFNPFAWWAVRKFTECGEWACDQQAAGRDRAGATEYARTLLQLGTAGVSPAAGAAAIRGSPLFHRIGRLVSAGTREDALMKRIILVGIALGLVVFSLVRIELVAREPRSTELAPENAPEPFPWHPEELVTVLGEERGRQWSWISTLALSPDGGQLASAGFQDTIWLWDAKTLELQTIVEVGHERGVESLGYLWDGRLVSAGGDGKLRVWDLSAAKPKLQTSLATDSGPGMKAAWAADGRTLVTFQPASPRFHMAAGSTEGRTVGSIGPKGPRVWDASAQEIREKAAFAFPASPETYDLTPEEHDVAEAFGATGITCQFNRTAVALSPDGSLLAVASGGASIWMRGKEPGEAKSIYRESDVTLWDLSGQAPMQVGQSSRAPCVTALACAPDGKTVALACAKGELRLWKLSGAGTEEEAILAAGGRTEAVAFSPDGTLLAAGGYGQGLRVWDFRGEPPVECSIAPSSGRDVRAILFTRDGSSLFAADSGAIHRRDRVGSTFRRAPAGPGHGANVSSLALTPDGKTLISAGGPDGTLRFWDFETRENKELAILSDWEGQTDDVAVSPDGTRMVFDTYTPSAYKLRLWDLAGREPKELAVLDLEKGHPGSFWSVAFAPDGATLATGHRDGAIRLWDISAGTFERGPSFEDAHANGVCSLDYSPDGKTLASSGWNRTVALWDVAGSEIRPRQHVGRHDDIARQVRFSPDGKLLASGDQHGVIKLWDLQGEDATSRELPQHEDLISSLSFDADGRRLLSAGRDGRVVLWDLPSGKALRKWKFPGSVWDAAFDPTGRYVVTANGNGSIYVLRNPTAKAPAG